MNLPAEYKTGNAKMDAKIAAAFIKNPLKKNMLQQLADGEAPGKARINVAGKSLRTYSDGTVFDSLGEMERWDYLLKLQSAGEITNLRRQVVFILDESFIHRQWGDIPDVLYIADFDYINISFRKGFEGRECVEDYKGYVLTDTYKMKRRWFLRKYAGYLFFEV